MKRAMFRMLGVLLPMLLLAGCCAHDWQAATCTVPKTCAKCGETEGEALGHDWQDATCSAPKTCTLCGKTVGTTLEHEAGEWEIEAEADFRSLGLRTRSCIHCGETMEEEEYYLPVYEDGKFALSANTFARLCGEAWDGAVESSIEEDGTLCVLFIADDEPVARAVFLDEDGAVLSVDDPDADACAPTMAISAVGEDEEAYRLALQAVISSCRNEPVPSEADKLLANIGYALATGDLYSTDGLSYFWGSCDDGAALYISAGEIDALYEQRAIIPYFDFTFEELVAMFNAAPEDVNGGWSIERLEDGSFAMYNINGSLAGGVVGLDYTEEKFEASDGSVALEKFNELLVVLVASPEEDEDGQGLLATVIAGSMVGLTMDESFTPAYFLNECAEGSIGRGAWRGNGALVCETDGYRYSLSQSGNDYYIFLIQKLQG